MINPTGSWCWQGLGFLLTRYPSSTLSLFHVGVSLLKLKSRKKGALSINGFLVNLVVDGNLVLCTLNPS